MNKGNVTDRELRKLSRADLLELLLAESRENEMLRAQLKEAQEKLASREIELQNAGSIAEAALRLNGVFEAAEQAAQQYLENIRRISEGKSHEKES
ncbi:DNA repair protein [Ruminococcus sp. 5_1_39BFAA]|uniref:DNA repair protein n=1 Tax=Ruminococcus sp. 5_1_39BFAA TaxID=457412 RepID=UPI003565713E